MDELADEVLIETEESDEAHIGIKRHGRIFTACEIPPALRVVTDPASAAARRRVRHWCGRCSGAGAVDLQEEHE